MADSDASYRPADGLDYAAIHRYALAGRTAHNVTHDVNNFLGAILAYSELVDLDPGVGAESKRMLSEITKAVQKSTGLLRTIAQITKNVQSPRSAANLDMVLNQVLDLCRYDMKIHQIQLTSALAEGLPSIEIEETRVERALAHLLMNATEQCVDNGLKEIRLELCRVENFLEVRVRNPGSAVAAQHRERIFEPYYTTKMDGHLGLGLSESRKTAETHGGTLSYDDERGFVFRLPLPST